MTDEERAERQRKKAADHKYYMSRREHRLAHQRQYYREHRDKILADRKDKRQSKKQTEEPQE